jgi:ABC-type nitrate/sulfonate/bicarbonate transport system substrate-binding protein
MILIRNGRIEMAGIHELLKGGLFGAAIALLPQILLPQILLSQAALAQSKPAPANVRFAIMGVANFTPVLVARDKGFFTEENLNVTWTTVNQGAIAVEAVFGGSAEIGGGSIFEPMVARSNGLDMMFMAPSTRIRSTPPDNSGVTVRTNDPIKTAKDLVGKKVSAGLINGPNYVHMREWLQRNGVDPASVEFLEIPFPQMADALFQNRLDAVWNVEPFLTFMVKSGNARVIAYPYQENVPNMDITGYVARESWLKANPDVARRVRRALDRATAEMIKAGKPERDDFVAKYTGAKPEIVAALNLAEFTTEFNVPSLKSNLDIAVRQKLAKPFDVETMIWKP